MTSTISLTSALYPSHSPFLGTDPVFATKKSLICDLTTATDATEWKKLGYTDSEIEVIKRGSGRVWIWKYDFVLPTIEEVEALKKAM